MFAVTERLLLRPGWAEDATALTQALSDPAIARMLARVPAPYTLEDAEGWLALAPDPHHPSFLICRRDTAALVGGIGFSDLGGGEPQLGYWIARSAQGQGLATEAGLAALALADHSLRLPRVRASHALDNPASARVLERLGFTESDGETSIVSAARGGPMPVRSLVRPRFGALSARLAT